jgi:hypothetical protein
LIVRRLRDFQMAILTVGGTEACCRVVAVGGDEAVLQPEHPHLLSGSLLPGTATLVFETGRHPVLLSGMADTGPVPGTARFWITDAVGQRDLRLRPRLKVDFDVTVVPLAADGQPSGPPVRRITRDLSAGGLLVDDHPPAAPGDLVLVILEVPAIPQPVQACARVVRVLPGAVALQFEDLDEGVGETIDTLIFMVRQQVARRAFLRAA